MKRTPLPPRSTPLKRSPVRKKRKTARRGPMRSKAYLWFLKIDCRCVACVRLALADPTCSFQLLMQHRQHLIDPAHGPVNGRGSKGPDNEAIPLCRYHHEEQHRLGWPAFESKYGFSREKEAAAHYAAFLLTGRL